MTRHSELQLAGWSMEPETRPAAPQRRQVSVASPQAIFVRAFRRLDVKRPVPDFRVEYRAFSGLRSAIRMLPGNRAQVLISDLLTDAPPIVVEALAEILLSRVLGLRPSREARACYKSCVMSPAMRRQIDEVRRARGHKRLLPPQGRYFDLELIFDRLNEQFFQGKLWRPRLGWSIRKSRRILGHYDSAHGTITVSRWFDSHSVPGYLIEYLVFHEMLHLCHPLERKGHRRVVHSRAFLEAEKTFPMYEAARERLKSMSVRQSRWRSPEPVL